MRRMQFGRGMTTVFASAVMALLASSAVAQSGSAIGNIDCTAQEEFKVLTRITNESGGTNSSNVVVVTGGYLLVLFSPDKGYAEGHLHFYDLSNPRSPQLARRISNAESSQLREPHALPIARIEGKEYVAMQSVTGVQIWDVSDPLNARRVGDLALSGVAGGDYENAAWQTIWQGRYLYVAGSNLGLFVVDAGDPANPRLLKRIPTGQTGGFRIGPLYAAGDYLFLSNMDQDGAYAMMDIRVPDSPTLVATKSGLPLLYSTLVTGDRVYAAGREGDFLIHSITDPFDIHDVSAINVGGDLLYVASQDDHVFAGRQYDFVKIDVSNETNPVAMGTGSLENALWFLDDHGQMTPMGNLLYVGNDHGTGNALFCHQRGRDTTPPTVKHILPIDGTVAQDVGSRVTIAFSDYLDTRTIGTSTVSVRPVGGAPLDGIYTYAFNTLHFQPNAAFSPDTTYEIVVSAGGIKDVMGNAVATTTIARFSTGSSLGGPTDPGPTTDAGTPPPSADGSVPGTSDGGASDGGDAGMPTSDAGSGDTDSGMGNPDEVPATCSTSASPPTGLAVLLLAALLLIARRRVRVM